MRVDLPAPLSPTSAVTLPAYACMSTPLSTSTGPKLLRMSRISMIGTATSAPHLLLRGLPGGRALFSDGGAGAVVVLARSGEHDHRYRRCFSVLVELVDAGLLPGRRDCRAA